MTRGYFHPSKLLLFSCFVLLHSSLTDNNHMYKICFPCEYETLHCTFMHEENPMC